MAIKQAEMPGLSSLDVKLNQPENRQMANVLKNIILTGGAAFAAGAGVRGIQGLGDLARGTLSDPPKMPLQRQFIDVPIQRRHPRESEGPLRALAKQALDQSLLEGAMHGGAAAANAAGAAMGGGLGGGLLSSGNIGNALNATARRINPHNLPPPSWLTRLSGGGLDLFGALDKSTNPIKSTLVNPGAEHWWQHPWAIPAAGLAVGGGLLLGHHTADRAITTAKDNEDDSELAEAKRRYEQALGGKQAAVTIEEPYTGLDRVWDVLEKHANSIQDLLGGPLGLALAGLGAVGLGSGIGAYNYVRGHSPSEAVDRAMRERRERMFAQGPPAIVAVPRELDDEPPALDIRAIRHKIEQLRAPKSAAVPPAQAAQQTLGQLHTQAEQTRLQARAALGIQEETPKTETAEPMPHRPPSVAQALSPR